jgi:hypothetical protein
LFLKAVQRYRHFLILQTFLIFYLKFLSFSINQL